MYGLVKNVYCVTLPITVIKVRLWNQSLWYSEKKPARTCDYEKLAIEMTNVIESSPSSCFVVSALKFRYTSLLIFSKFVSISRLNKTYYVRSF